MGPTNVDILLLEQDRNQALLLADFLMKRECSVETAMDATTALAGAERRRVNNRHYDLVIIAHAPPAIDGLAIAQEMRRRQPYAMVILTAPFGPGSPQIHSQGMQLGCRKVLDQPVDLAELERSISDIRALRNANAAIETGTFFPSTQRYGGGTGTPTGQHEALRTPTGNHQLGTPTGAHQLGTPPGTQPLPQSNMPMGNDPAYQRQASSYQNHSSGYTRIPSTAPFDSHTQFERPRRTTGRIRRSVTGGSDSSAQKPAVGSESLGNPAMGGLPMGGQPPLPLPTQPTQPPQMPLPPGTKPLDDGEDDPFLDSVEVIQESGQSVPAPGSQPISSRFHRRTGGTSSFLRTIPDPDNPNKASAPQAALQTKQVACAHCHQVFSVALKAKSYTVVCIHCGGLNRIDPQ